MACNNCMSNVFKDKLGRCKQCILLNFLLLMVMLIIYFTVDIRIWLAVEQLTFLIFLWGCASLLFLHIAAWCFYRLKE